MAEDIPFNFLVFSGGGANGHAFMGALQYLDELNDKMYNRSKMTKFAGTSIGSIVATLLAMGYSFNELITKLATFSYDDCHNIKLLTMFDNFGLDNFDNMNTFIESLFAHKKYAKTVTFEELHLQTNTYLLLNAVSLKTGNVEYFDYVNTPHMPIMKALNCTMAVPFLFTPIKWNDNLYIDGGICENIITNPFINLPRIESEDKVLYFNLKYDEGNCPMAEDFYGYSSRVFSIISKTYFKNQISFPEKEQDKYLHIVLDNTTSVNFFVDDDDRKYLIETGWKYASKFHENDLK